MASSKSLKLMCMAMLCVVALLLSGATAAATCNSVASSLSDCLPYLENGGTPTSSCCSGIKSINASARTTPDRRDVCNCIKQLVSKIHYSSANAGYASALPSKCEVSIPYKISPSTDCKSIS